eukprot:1265756-Pleurochrysis_carterae.AAC.3
MPRDHRRLFRDCLPSQYGRLELTSAHGHQGRRVLRFEGYTNQSERDLLRYVKKQLEELVARYPRDIIDSLRHQVDPILQRIHGPPPLPPEEEEDALIQ